MSLRLQNEGMKVNCLEEGGKQNHKIKAAAGMLLKCHFGKLNRLRHFSESRCGMNVADSMIPHCDIQRGGLADDTVLIPALVPVHRSVSRPGPKQLPCPGNNTGECRAVRRQERSQQLRIFSRTSPVLERIICHLRLRGAEHFFVCCFCIPCSAESRLRPDSSGPCAIRIAGYTLHPRSSVPCDIRIAGCTLRPDSFVPFISRAAGDDLRPDESGCRFCQLRHFLRVKHKRRYLRRQCRIRRNCRQIPLPRLEKAFRRYHPQS